MKVSIPNERQTKISFDPVPHKYYDDGGIEYTSVTTLIGKYAPKFNKRYWSMYTALRDAGYKVRGDNKQYKVIYVDGIPRSLDSLYKITAAANAVKDVTNEWTRLTNVACNRGNLIHDGLETDINASKGDLKGESNSIIQPHQSLEGVLLKINTVEQLDDTGLQFRYPEIYKRLVWYISQDCIIYAEKRIYSTAYQIAGMIDVLIVKRGTNKFAILDWKTNKDKMHFESGYYKKVKIGGKWVKSDNFIQTFDDKLHSPIEHLDNCKGVKYSLQLSLYAYVMELWGYELVGNGLTICHIRPDMKPIFINCHYYKNEIASLLLDHYVKNVIKLEPEKPKVTFGISA
ncbi:MAG: hypothetical protein CMC35_02795 [Flavobacteriaceae bacterium]|nr:hypothetical protein [Flavobacteriaceae bacterium]|tara:strand:+ start:1312 stop:2343 length:1032 start_codon:yes stop_codon:yes gene_type:complete